MKLWIVSKIKNSCTYKIDKDSSFFNLFFRIDPFLFLDWLKFYLSSKDNSTEKVTLLILLIEDELLTFLSSFELILWGWSTFLSYFSGKWVFFLTRVFLFEDSSLKRFLFLILFLISRPVLVFSFTIDFGRSLMFATYCRFYLS